MLDSIKAIQAQQLFKVQPVSFNEGSNGRRPQETTFNQNANFFMRGAYNLEYPSDEGSPVLGRSLDFRA